jgi:methylated-DNA-[protein]-cysteine S-methyltransferase
MWPRCITILFQDERNFRIASNVRSTLDDPAPTHLDAHISACLACRRRWDQAVQLDRLRRESSDVTLASSHARVVQLPSQGVLYTAMLSPLGTLWIAAGPQGLVRVDSFVDEVAFCHAIERDGYGIPCLAPPELDGITAQFEEYFAGRRTAFALPIDLSRETPFRRAVLEAVLSVPFGVVQSYQDIAFSVGKPAAARAVAGVVATSPISLVIPCHRIIRSDGTAGEYAVRTLGSCGAHYKLMLLSLEGLTRIIDTTGECAM